MAESWSDRAGRIALAKLVLPGSPMDQKTPPFFPLARLANGVLSLLHSWVHHTPEDAPPAEAQTGWCLKEKNFRFVEVETGR